MNTFLVIFVTVLVAIVTSYYFRRTTPNHEFVRSFNESYDYIVVGGGAAGLVLANRLSEDDDVTVLLLEAGKSESDKPMYDVPYNAPKAQMTEADWIYRTVPQMHAQWGMHDKVGIWPQGKGLGGSTLLNGLAYVRGSRHDYDSWAANGCDGWSYDDVLPYFLKSEDMRDEKGFDKDYHSRGGPIAVSDAAMSEVVDVYLEAAKELGFKVHDCNGNDGIQDGFCRMQAIVGDGQRCNAARGFLHPVLGRKNLHVATQSHVTKVLIENKRAVGVEFIQEGRKKTVSSRREVVLSAGAIGSAQILMLSGVGPRDHLTDLGIKVIADLPVGSTLRDHMMFFVKADIEKPVSYTFEKVFTTANWLKYYLFGTELEIKVTSDSPSSASYLDLDLSYGNNGHLSTKIYDKRDDFNFSIVDVPFLSSNIPASPAYGAYMSQLIRYPRARSSYQDFLARSLLVTNKLGLLTNNAALESQGFIRTNPESPEKYPDIQLCLVSSLAEHGDSYGHFNYRDDINEAVFRAIHEPDPTPEGFSVAIMLIHPKSKGTLRLVSRDPFDYPLLDPNYLSDPRDVKTIVRGIRQFQKFLKTDALKKVGTKFHKVDIPECKHMIQDSDEEWECLVRHLATTLYHPASTCRMGPSSDPTAVVDPQLRVKGISGLRVADCSVMPNLTSGNTMAPTFMIAEKAADLIRGKVTVRKRI